MGDRWSRCPSPDRLEHGDGGKEGGTEYGRGAVLGVGPLILLRAPPGECASCKRCEDECDGCGPRGPWCDLGTGRIGGHVELDARPVESDLGPQAVDLGVDGDELGRRRVPLGLEDGVVRVLLELLVEAVQLG